MTKQSQTLASLRERRDDILQLAARHGASDVRVFGSIAKGEAAAQSDVDLLVTFKSGSSIFDQVGLWLDLIELLQCEVDLLADHPDAGEITKIARQEAVFL